MSDPGAREKECVDQICCFAKAFGASSQYGASPGNNSENSVYSVKIPCSAAQVFYHGFGARVDVQFFVHGAYVAADGVNADIHAVGDFLVGIAVGQLAEEFAFAGGEVGEFGRAVGRF